MLNDDKEKLIIISDLLYRVFTLSMVINYLFNLYNFKMQITIIRIIVTETIINDLNNTYNIT